MWIKRSMRSFTEACRSPWGRVILLSAYYTGIIVVLILLYGKGELTPTNFIYQGF
jgi:hypothetical protein